MPVSLEHLQKEFRSRINLVVSRLSFAKDKELVKWWFLYSKAAGLLHNGFEWQRAENLITEGESCINHVRQSFSIFNNGHSHPSHLPSSICSLWQFPQSCLLVGQSCPVVTRHHCLKYESGFFKSQFITRWISSWYGLRRRSQYGYLVHWSSLDVT